jgi:6-pyruvoyltetrahydropterin/6-carboxytetrahydropterin synthase
MQKNNITSRGVFKTYNYELIFDYTGNQPGDYEVAEAEVKRIGIGWVEETLGGDTVIQSPILPVQEDQKVWNMSLNGKDQDCEPTIQHITKEIFLAMAVIFESNPALQIQLVSAYEPEAGFATCTKETITPQQAQNWLSVNYTPLKSYADSKSYVEYQDPKA